MTLNGAIWDSLQSHSAASCLQHARSSGQSAFVRKSRASTSGAHHVQHVVSHVVRRKGLAVKFNNNHNNRIQRRKSRYFYNLLTAPRTVSNTYLKWPWRKLVQIKCNTSSAYHVQHVVLRATWYEGTVQLLSLTEFKSHLFELYLIGWTIKPMKFDIAFVLAFFFFFFFFFR